jgi:N-acetylmuramoyl-L-alanine amidase
MRPLLLTSVLLLATATAVRAQLVDLRIAAGESQRSVPAVSVGGTASYRADALQVIGGRVSVVAGRARVVLFGDTLDFQSGSPFFRRGATLHQLAYPVAHAGSDVLLPEQFFIEWLPAHYPQRVEYGAGVLRAHGPVARERGTQRRLVVIDPGHGGVDPGKIGPNGLREKDLTLSIGRQVADLLRERGYEVQMTRTRDTLISLADRPRMANRWKDGRAAALFLSIHANSAPSNSAAGFETFFLAEPRTEDERRVAEMENAAVRFEQNGSAAELPDLEYILSHLLNDFYMRASNDLAEVVQRRLGQFHPGRNRGVKQAGFRVLVGALMPAVLIEVGFLSNADEARLLATAAFQHQLAMGIAAAVEQFFAEHEHLLISDSP